jgi:hypothetical protein
MIFFCINVIMNIFIITSMFIPCILNNKLFIIDLQYLYVHMLVYNKQSLSFFYN